MDIKKFNKVLGTKIAKAKSYENHGNLETAIELWLEISDLTLKASKQPNLDFTYRHMLISKTEQIIEHVKELKTPKKKEPIVEDFIIQEDIIKAPETNEEIEIERIKSKKTEEEDFSGEITQRMNESARINHKIIEDNDFKNIPDGVKEIEASKDFMIITPHDSNYVEKMKKLSEEVDMNIYKKPKIVPSKEVNDLGDKRICFACGTILPPNSKICTECGTKLG